MVAAPYFLAETATASVLDAAAAVPALIA